MFFFYSSLVYFRLFNKHPTFSAFSDTRTFKRFLFIFISFILSLFLLCLHSYNMSIIICWIFNHPQFHTLTIIELWRTYYTMLPYIRYKEIFFFISSGESNWLNCEFFFFFQISSQLDALYSIYLCYCCNFYIAILNFFYSVWWW